MQFVGNKDEIRLEEAQKDVFGDFGLFLTVTVTPTTIDSGVGRQKREGFLGFKRGEDLKRERETFFFIEKVRN